MVTFERVALLLLLALVLWEGRTLNQQERYLAQLAGEVVSMRESAEADRGRQDRRDEQLADLQSNLRARPAAPTAASQLGAPAAPPAREGAAEPAPPATAPLPGDPVAARALRAEHVATRSLNRLYDAADRMAADEGWSTQTYDKVAGVFEESMTSVLDVWSALQTGDMNPVQARDEAVTLRDDAQQRLTEILGPDGVERMKGYMRGPGRERP